MSDMGQMMIIYFLVNSLLMLGINKLCGYWGSVARVLLGTLYGSIFAGICLLPELVFVNRIFLRLAGMLTAGFVAFGCTGSGIYRCIMYLLLQTVLGSIAQGAGNGGTKAMTAGAAVIFLGCMLLLRFRRRDALYIPVELTYCERTLSLTALRDTGNSLRDPVTGKPVLIIDSLAAENLVGLDRRQLSNPLETIGVLPGLRLIPYKTVGGTGFLLALRMTQVKIGNRQGSGIVAFSPEVLSMDGQYQALTGGVF